MIYLLYGDEETLIEQKVSALKKAFFKDTKLEEQVVNKFDYKSEGLNSFLKDFEQLSFNFMDKKVYLIFNATFLTSETQFKKEMKLNESKIISSLEDLRKDTDNLVIFISNDQKILSNKVIDIFSKDNVIPFFKINKNAWPQLVKNYFVKKEFKISEDAINEIVLRCNYDLASFKNEALKLTLYVEDKNITLENVKEIVSFNPNDNVFALTNAILENNPTKIFNAYNDLKLLGEEPITLIKLLSTNLFFVDQVLYLKELNKDYISIANTLNQNKYRVKITMDTKLKRSSVKKMLDDLEKLDKDIKLGNIDRFIGFEIFLSSIK